MRSDVGRVWSGLFDLIVPPMCWTCRAGSVNLFCAKCLRQLNKPDDHVCPRCASTRASAMAAANICGRCLNEDFAFDAAVRCGPYAGLHREIVLQMKSPNGEPLAEAASTLFADALAPRIREHSPDIVVPVPIHWRRRWRRGYNVSDVLARALAERLQLPFAQSGLRRRRSTEFQWKLSPERRKVNVRGAFALGSKVDVTGKVVVLVDDVMTTGATAQEASRILRSAKAAKIVVAVFAHEAPR